MAINLFSFVDMYSRALDTAAHVLSKGAEHARATGVSEADMLEWRLAPDMFPLRRQIQTVASFAMQWPARVAGAVVPEAISGDQSVADLMAAIAHAKAYLATLKPEQFAGRDNAPLTIEMGPASTTHSAGHWLSGFATTNLYFHLSMVYGILRHKGVQLGKRDLFASGL